MLSQVTIQEKKIHFPTQQDINFKKIGVLFDNVKNNILPVVTQLKVR